MGKPGDLYLPSSGTEGACWFDSWCCHCARDKSMREGADFDECDDNEKCDIIARSFIGPVKEWGYGESGHPKCTAYIESWEGLPEMDTHTIDMFSEAT